MGKFFSESDISRTENYRSLGPSNMDSSYLKTPKYQFSENSVRWRKV